MKPTVEESGGENSTNDNGSHINKSDDCNNGGRNVYSNDIGTCSSSIHVAIPDVNKYSNTDDVQQQPPDIASSWNYLFNFPFDLFVPSGPSAISNLHGVSGGPDGISGSYETENEMLAYSSQLPIYIDPNWLVTNEAGINCSTSSAPVTTTTKNSLSTHLQIFSSSSLATSTAAPVAEENQDEIARPEAFNYYNFCVQP